jgi:hypothetical protein
MRPAIIEQVKQSKFICSACGSARNCDCAAPALERLAELKEQARQRDRAYKERKREQKQQTGDVANDAAASAEARKAHYGAEPQPGANSTRMIMEMTRSALDSAKLIKKRLKDDPWKPEDLKNLLTPALAASAAWEETCSRLQELIPEQEPLQSARPVSPTDDLSIPDYLKRAGP